MELSPEHHEHPSILEGDAFPTPNSVDQAVNSISTDGRARIIDKPSENDGECFYGSKFAQESVNTIYMYIPN